MPDFDERDVTSILANIGITEQEVLNLLKNKDASKAMGPNDIHPYVLKSLPDLFAEPLALILRKSIDTETLPRDWEMLELWHFLRMVINLNQATIDM